MGTMLPIRNIFISLIPKNLRIWPGKSFHVQKITGTLKMNICSESVQQPSYYFKAQLPKRKFKEKKKNFFGAPKMEKLVFDLVK